MKLLVSASALAILSACEVPKPVCEPYLLPECKPVTLAAESSNSLGGVDAPDTDEPGGDGSGGSGDGDDSGSGDDGGSDDGSVGDHDNGHGNDSDGHDEDNPGKGKGHGKNK